MQRLFIPTIFIVMCLFSFVCPTHAANDQALTVEFPSTIHFLNPAGEDIEVGPGVYQVEAVESWLKLVPEGLGRTEAVLLEATSGKHDEALTESEVRLEGEVEGEEENPDIFHLAMLLPDGTGLEAIGTISGIRPRGTQMVFLSRSNLKISSQVESLPRAKVSFPALKYYKSGFVSKRDSDFTDRCVPNVENQITKTLHNGKDQKDILAYRSGLKGAPSQENRGLHKAGRTGRDSWKHRQGIARYFSGTQNFFYISSSVTSSWTKAGKFAGVEVVKWSNTRHSGRLGSNIGNNRGQAPRVDFAVGKYVQELNTDHAGGMQIYGRILAVPYFAARDFIRLYDLNSPMNPQPIQALRSTKDVQFGFAALTRLNNGRYLAIGGDDRLEVFVSEGTSPLGAWKSHSAYKPPKGFVDDPRGPANMKYQGAQFITDCSGILYLALTRKSINTFGSYKNDWIDVWRAYVRAYKGTYTIGLSKVFNRHMYCGGGGGSLWCNFVAGAGMYIDPKNGDLLAYGIEHWNDGPKVNGVESTKMKEFPQK